MAAFRRQRRWGSAPVGFAGALIMGLAGCGQSSHDAPDDPPAPSMNATLGGRATRAINEPPLKNTAVLAMQVDSATTKLPNAIIYAENGALRFAASAGSTLGCENIAPAWGVHYIAASIDAGPNGDYYFGRSIPVYLNARIPHDSQSARDIHPSVARLELGPWPEDGSVPPELTVHVEARRSLAQPSPQPNMNFGVSGTVSAMVCPSAAVLLGAASRTPRPTPTQWVHVDIGDQHFDPATIIAFSTDPEKTGAGITSLGFYAAPNARCDNATRPLFDNGGGIDGLQVETGPVAISQGKKSWGFTQPITGAISDVTTGRGAFAQVYLTKPSATIGYIHVGEVDYSKEETGTISGYIHLENLDAHMLVDGLFSAKICKPQQ